ncbi:hypothetical protein HDU85_005436 [Gaertneriomyces sp. JEL0708]|nr:hypothetical protein HDU85_005436 [Gaertneriomyces sp. JEL0708]
MPNYNIRGVTVQFPYDAYDCQVSLMDSVIAALQGGKNALIESPTGTGKTVSLLCAALAWREAFAARTQLGKLLKGGLQLDSFQAGLAQQLNDEAPENTSVTIYYASRTHSQLSQVISELRNTSYKPQICVLGSRSQMCINHEVTRLANAAQTSACRQQISATKCEYYSNVRKSDVKEYQEEKMLDIEDLVKFGRLNRACPYFIARSTQVKADIIFLPYNYLVDPYARVAQGIDERLKNSIVIFDEGHNLEGSCGSATSFELSSSDITSCILEAKLCVELSRGSTTKDDFEKLHELLVKLQLKLAAVDLRGKRDMAFPGNYIMELLGSINITADTVETICSVIERAVALMSKEPTPPRVALDAIASGLRVVFRPQNEYDLASFRVVIQTENDSSHRKLSFWCLSSGVAMRDLLSQGCRSVIVASGTLSPLESISAEMGIPFPIRLENPHVIQPEQVFVGVISTGPAGSRLSSSFENRRSSSYLSDLGNTVVNFARVVPDGLLVFFPSYGVLTMCLDAWRVRQTGRDSVWDQLRRIKEPFVEPRGKDQFSQAMDEFVRKLEDSNLMGAVLFAVCRGKASEGIDFSDAKGRAVLVCGIPYPAAMDPKVRLKKEHLDDLKAGAKNNAGAMQQLGGNDWYQQQAMRAVNQAIGRVIRHKKDWGAILLCDARFSSSNLRRQLSAWVRPYVRVYDHFDEAHGALGRFVKHMSSRPVPQPACPAIEAFQMKTSKEQDEYSSTLNSEWLQQLVRQGQQSSDTVPAAGLMSIKARRSRLARQNSNHMWADVSGSVGGEFKDDMHPPHSTSHLQSENATAAALCHPPMHSVNVSATHRFQRMAHHKISEPNIQTSIAQHQLTMRQNSTENSPQRQADRVKTRDDVREPYKRRMALQELNLTKKRGVSSSTGHITPCAEKANARVAARAYVEKVKYVLSADEYKTFQRILREYKSKVIDLHKLIDSLLRLFDGTAPELVLEFQMFVPKKHLGTFLKAADSFIAH